MSNIANISFDQRTNKWIATYNGQVLGKSQSFEHLTGIITEGRCKRAVQANVTHFQVIGDAPFLRPSNSQDTEEQQPQQVEDRFTIDQRFEFLEEFVRMVADGTSPSLIVTGDGGLGKSFTIIEVLESCGLKDATTQLIDGEIGAAHSGNSNFFYTIKGFSTAKALYRKLYENRNRILLLDDVDVFKDPTAKLILKAALDSTGRRIISWNSEQPFGSEDDLPQQFEFKGGIIFITNTPSYKIDQAIRTRSILVDVSMNSVQKVERMRTIVHSPKFLPEIDIGTKLEAVDFIASVHDRARELSLRTLLSISRIASRGGEWQARAEYILCN